MIQHYCSSGIGKSVRATSHVENSAISKIDGAIVRSVSRISAAVNG